MLVSIAQFVRTHALQLLLLACAPAVVFSNTLDGGFVWLDRVEIVDGGYRLTKSGDLSKLLCYSLQEFVHRDVRPLESSGGYWRPLYGLSLTLSWALFGTSTALHHVENVFWHVLTAWMLFALGRMWTGADARPWGPAFWSALIFAVHPLGITSVTWISGRKDLQCAFLCVAAVACYGWILRRRERDLLGRREFRLSSLLPSVLLLMALGFKETAAVVPLIAAIYLGNRWTKATSGQRHHALVSNIGMFVVVGSWFLYRTNIIGHWSLDAPSLPIDFSSRAATLGSLQAHYLGLVVNPAEPRLSDAWPLHAPLDLLTAFMACIFIGLIIGLGIRFRNHPACLGMLWYFVLLLPASGIMPLFHLRAERYLYPASWGLLFALTVLVFSIVGKRKLAVVKIVVFSAFTGWAGYTTFQSNRYWIDHESLFRRAITLDSKYIEGHVALGNELLSRGDYADASAHFERAEQVRLAGAVAAYCPSFVLYSNYGLARYHLRQYEDAARLFEKAAEIRPEDFRAHYHLGLIARRLGRLDAARRHYLNAQASKPDDRLTISNLAAVELAAGRYDVVIELLQPIVSESPDDLGILVNLAQALMSTKRFGASAELWKRAIRIDERDVDLRARLALCLFRNGRLEEACKVIQRAKEIGSDHPSVQAVEHEIGCF